MFLFHKWKQVKFRLYIRIVFYNIVFYNKGGETLKKIAQRSYGYPVPGTVQGLVGWGFVQPDVVEDVPAHGCWLD